MNNRQSFIILMAALAVATGASAETYVWTGALDSSWSVSQNWQPQGVPNASTAFARIDADPGKTSQVSLSDTSTSYSLGGLMIDADDSLSVGNGCVLTLFSTGGLTNNGALRVNAGGSYTYLRFNGSQTLFGAGELVLNDNSLNLVQLLGTQPVLTQAAGHTLRGAGQLLYNTGDLINEGTVLAQGVNALKIDPRNAFVNRGTLRAEGAGGLELDAAAYTNTGHTVEAGDGSKVVLKYGARLAGGTLMTEGTGRIWPQDGAYLQGGGAPRRRLRGDAGQRRGCDRARRTHQRWLVECRLVRQLHLPDLQRHTDAGRRRRTGALRPYLQSGADRLREYADTCRGPHDPRRGPPAVQRRQPDQ
jgi:hypothetical protein